MALADELFPGQEPVGKRIAWTGDVVRFTPYTGDWRTVVGVVGNTRDGGLDAAPRPAMFMPFAQELTVGGGLVIRADGQTSQLVSSSARIARSIAPNAPIENVLTVGQIKDQSVAPRRLNAALVSSFGILAVIIAAVGIAGVIAFSVSARTNEIGIRRRAAALLQHLTAERRHTFACRRVTWGEHRWPALRPCVRILWMTGQHGDWSPAASPAQRGALCLTRS